MSSLGYPALSRTVRLLDLKRALILSLQVELCAVGTHSLSDGALGAQGALCWAAKQSAIGHGAEHGPSTLPTAWRWASWTRLWDATLPGAVTSPWEPRQKVPSWLQSGCRGDANPSSAVGTKLKLR